MRSWIQHRWFALAEVALFYTLVQIVIWGGREHRPASIVIVLSVVVLCVSSNLLHKDSIDRIGLSSDHFWPNMKLTALTCGPLVFLLWIFAWQHRFDGVWDLRFSFLGYPIWALVQEYTLLSFVGNRLEDAFSRSPLVPWINGLLFSMGHLPNPVLMVATFTSGVLFTHIFFRHRHLVPLALVHAAFGVGISLALGTINGIMSVGPGYYLRVGTLPY